MKKFTILSVVLAISGKSMADCWSSAMGYPCCNGCSVVTEDNSGKWGIENNNWCGINDNICNNNNNNNQCWSLPSYPCCKNTSEIVYQDGDGDWGFENNNWCGIVKNGNTNQNVQKTCWSLPQYQCCNGNEVVYTDGDGDWGFENGQWCGIIKSTNNNGNNNNGNNTQVEPVVDDHSPKFSMESGYYEYVNGMQLTLNSEGTIYYTLDGSDPTNSSTAKIYNGPISIYDKSIDPNGISMHQYEENSPYSIQLQNKFKASTNKNDKATVIRAATKLSNGTFSPVVTKTFLVMNNQNLKFYSDLPVVSLVTDPSNLFDKDKGIYVCGQQYLDWKRSPNYNPNKSEWDADNIANFFSKGKEWERPASLTLFVDGKEVKTQNIGIRIKGASTRNQFMKSFNVYARKEYGEGKFEYELLKDNKNFITNKTIKKYDSFSLRHVNWFDRMRESVVQSALKDYPIIATYDNQKSLLFIDGEFWGLYDIIEKSSDYYIKSNYDIPTENVAMIKNDELQEGTQQDLQDFRDLVNYCKYSDMTNDNNYNYVAQRMDLDSLIYHYAIGLYLGIWDWPNRNYFVYRNNGAPIQGNEYADGKWRWGSFDFDYAAGITYDNFGGVEGYAHDSFTKFQKKNDEFPTPLFSKLMKNKKFYKRFSEIMHKMGDEIFKPSKMRTIISDQKSKYLKYIVKNDWRWYNGTPNIDYNTFTNLQNQYYGGGWDDIYKFFENRPNYVYRFMENTYGKVNN